MGPAFKPYPFKSVSLAGPARDSSRGERERIVIVGGGIAGLTLALGLAAQGVRSIVIEADATVYE